MNPGKKFLSDEEYAQMIEKIKAELVQKMVIENCYRI